MRKAECRIKGTVCILVSIFILYAAGCGSRGSDSMGNQGTGDEPADTQSGQDKSDVLNTDENSRTDMDADSKEEQPLGAGIKVDVPEHVKKQLHDNLRVDARVQNILDTSRGLYTYYADYDVLDDKQLQEIFFEADEAVKTEADTENRSYRCETTDGGKYAFSNEMTVSFRKLEYEDYGKVISFCTDSRHMYPDSFDAVDIPEQLSFMTPEEAKRIVRETAGKMDILLEPEPYVSAPLDEEALNALYQEVYSQLRAEVSAEWAEEVMQQYLPDIDFDGDKGCYYTLWRQQCPHGETIMSNNYVGEDNQVPHNMGSYVMGIVNEQGLVTFYAFYKYDFVQESPITENLLGVDEALEKIAELYKTVPLTETYCITNITLQYAAMRVNNEYGTSLKIVPAWCMETSSDNYRQYVVDAVSGALF